MDSNKASIHISEFETVFINFHGISSKCVLEIFGTVRFDRMNDEMDEAFGLKFIKCEGHEYIFSIKDKNKYLMAKILYGI